MKDMCLAFLYKIFNFYAASVNFFYILFTRENDRNKLQLVAIYLHLNGHTDNSFVYNILSNEDVKFKLFRKHCNLHGFADMSCLR